jgi:hypothetical protein
MGTSKSFEGISGNPNWSKLSRSVTIACDSGKISNTSLNTVASNFSKLIGGSNYGGRGLSKIGGTAGIRTAQRTGRFLNNVKTAGLIPALSGIGFEVTSTTKPTDILFFVLEYCAGVAATLDETASKAAEKQLLEEIVSDAKTFEELEQNFRDKIEEYGIEELLIRFYAYYIYEHLSIDFYEKLIVNKGRRATTNFFKQLKNFLLERLKNVSRKRDLSKINWPGNEGEELVKNIFEDTLKEFENYEG